MAAHLNESQTHSSSQAQETPEDILLASLSQVAPRLAHFIFTLRSKPQDLAEYLERKKMCAHLHKHMQEYDPQFLNDPTQILNPRLLVQVLQNRKNGEADTAHMDASQVFNMEAINALERLFANIDATTNQELKAQLWDDYTKDPRFLTIVSLYLDNDPSQRLSGILKQWKKTELPSTEPEQIPPAPTCFMDELAQMLGPKKESDPKKEKVPETMKKAQEIFDEQKIKNRSTGYVSLSMMVALAASSIAVLASPHMGLLLGGATLAALPIMGAHSFVSETLKVAAPSGLFPKCTHAIKGVIHSFKQMSTKVLKYFPAFKDMKSHFLWEGTARTPVEHFDTPIDTRPLIERLPQYDELHAQDLKASQYKAQTRQANEISHMDTIREKPIWFASEEGKAYRNKTHLNKEEQEQLDKRNKKRNEMEAHLLQNLKYFLKSDNPTNKLKLT